MDVLEGDELTITAKAAANPGPVTYSWWRGSEEVGGKEGKDGELKLGVLRRQQTHNYTVTAHSPRGTLTSAFFLNVLYGPEDLMTKEQVVVENGGSTTILCSAVGNPSPNITWSRNADNTSSVLAWGIGEARLVMELASRGDTGTYYCYAFSTVASIPPVSSTLIVQQAPWWRNDIPDEVLGGSWAAVGGSGRVECRVRAAPPPTFHWATQDGREITSGHKYTVEKPQLSDGVVEWRSVLEVRGVTARDYTHYTCTATNPLGKHSSLLALTPPLPPATPLHLTVGNVTSGQVWLYWKPNLSRSVPSGYIVRYWKTGDTEYQFVNVSGGERTAAVVEELAGGTKYSLTLQAYNLQGRSPHTSPPLTAVTLGVAESASSSTDGDGRSRVPRLILLIMTLAGTALLALNMAIIACFVRRRAAHNTRGVSDSMIYTNILLQRIECQTTTNDSEQTSLFRGEVGGTPVLSPVDDLLSNTNFKGRTRSQQNGRVLTQNGGHNVQKYRDDSSYYYSPIPQNSSISGDDGATRLTGNPPDVCPTTSDSRGTLIRRHQQPQQRGTTTTCPTELPEGPVTQHVTAHTHQPFHSSSTNKENVSRQSPGDKCHEHHPNNHHQQQIQKRSSPRGVERQEAPSQQEQQLDPYSYPHFDVAATATGVPGGYATVGSRKHRHTAATFSTLQRPGTSRPHSIPVGTAQQTPPGLQKATLPQGRHSRQQPHQDSTGHQQLSRAGGGGGSSTGAGQDDSGSSGYGGSPHQEMSVPSSVGTTTVTLGESGSLLPHMAAVISLPPNTSSTTLSRPRPSSQDGARKTKPELSMLLTRDPHSGGVNK
ncbi:Nephrin-like 14 [Homarus americanus]|uniref:Nephrin-like 14 n=1 Tax=Homarus americanus TaxID=6706 RepID=A0A8J5MTK3_HOMAM|nr:Nephrin-like 14 [Homarus americanus]